MGEMQLRITYQYSVKVYIFMLVYQWHKQVGGTWGRKPKWHLFFFLLYFLQKVDTLKTCTAKSDKQETNKKQEQNEKKGKRITNRNSPISKTATKCPDIPHKAIHYHYHNQESSIINFICCQCDKRLLTYFFVCLFFVYLDRI